MNIANAFISALFINPKTSFNSANKPNLLLLLALTFFLIIHHSTAQSFTVTKNLAISDSFDMTIASKSTLWFYLTDPCQLQLLVYVKTVFGDPNLYLFTDFNTVEAANNNKQIFSVADYCLANTNICLKSFSSFGLDESVTNPSNMVASKYVIAVNNPSSYSTQATLQVNYQINSLTRGMSISLSQAFNCPYQFQVSTANTWDQISINWQMKSGQGLDFVNLSVWASQAVQRPGAINGFTWYNLSPSNTDPSTFTFLSTDPSIDKTKPLYFSLQLLGVVLAQPFKYVLTSRSITSLLFQQPIVDSLLPGELKHYKFTLCSLNTLFNVTAITSAPANKQIYVSNTIATSTFLQNLNITNAYSTSTISNGYVYYRSTNTEVFRNYLNTGSQNLLATSNSTSVFYYLILQSLVLKSYSVQVGHVTSVSEICSLNPSYGPIAGNTPIVITGRNVAGFITASFPSETVLPLSLPLCPTLSSSSQNKCYDIQCSYSIVSTATNADTIFDRIDINSVAISGTNTDYVYSISSGVTAAQTFVPTTYGRLKGVTIYLIYTSSLTMAIQLEIGKNSLNGKLSFGSGESLVLESFLISSVNGRQTFTFQNPPLLRKGFVFTLKVSFKSGGNPPFIWRGSTNNVYLNGNALAQSSSLATFSSPGSGKYDFDFATIMGTGIMQNEEAVSSGVALTQTGIVCDRCSMTTAVWDSTSQTISCPTAITTNYLNVFPGQLLPFQVTLGLIVIQQDTSRMKSRKLATSTVFNYYVLLPQVTNIFPPLGPTSGGTVVDITGSNFQNTGYLFCKFGALTVSAAFLNSTNLRCSSPVFPGTSFVNLEISQTGHEYTSNQNKFTVYAPPTFSSATPLIGPTSGGTIITINISGYEATETKYIYCLFGSMRITPTSATKTTIICTSPPQASGLVVLDVTFNSQQTTNSNVKFYFFSPGGFNILSLSPTSGSIEGGTLVEVTGTGFLSISTAACRFQSYDWSIFISNINNELVCFGTENTLLSALNDLSANINNVIDANKSLYYAEMVSARRAFGVDLVRSQIQLIVDNNVNNVVTINKIVSVGLDSAGLLVALKQNVNLVNVIDSSAATYLQVLAAMKAAKSGTNLNLTDISSGVHIGNSVVSVNNAVRNNDVSGLMSILIATNSVYTNIYSSGSYANDYRSTLRNAQITLGRDLTLSEIQGRIDSRNGDVSLRLFDNAVKGQVPITILASLKAVPSIAAITDASSAIIDNNYSLYVPDFIATRASFSRALTNVEVTNIIKFENSVGNINTAIIGTDVDFLLLSLKLASLKNIIDSNKLIYFQNLKLERIAKQNVLLNYDQVQLQINMVPANATYASITKSSFDGSSDLYSKLKSSSSGITGVVDAGSYLYSKKLQSLALALAGRIMTMSEIQNVVNIVTSLINVDNAALALPVNSGVLLVSLKASNLLLTGILDANVQQYANVILVTRTTKGSILIESELQDCITKGNLIVSQSPSKAYSPLRATVVPGVAIPDGNGSYRIRCASPQTVLQPWSYGSGNHIVEVSLDGQTYTNSQKNFLFFNDRTSIASVSPVSGPAVGGTSVTISMSTRVIDVGNAFSKCRFDTVVVAGQISTATLTNRCAGSQIICNSPVITNLSISDTTGTAAIPVAVSFDNGQTFISGTSQFSYFSTIPKTSMVTQLSLSQDFSQLLPINSNAYNDFVLAFRGDISRALNVIISRVQVLSVRSSTIVSFSVAVSPDDSRSADDLLSQLQTQVTTSTSKLITTGKVTNSVVTTVSVPDLSTPNSSNFASISSLSPNLAPAKVAEDRTVIYVSGSNFKNTGGVAVRFGTETILATFINSTTIRCMVPSISLNANENQRSVAFDVSLNSQQFTASGLLFTFYKEPQITSMSPKSGPGVQGNTLVVLSGVNIFSSSLAVCRFGESQIVKATIINSSSMRCVSPKVTGNIIMTAAKPYIITVYISLNGVDFVPVTVSKFTYYATPVRFETPTPIAGPIEGGTEIIVKGSNFTNTNEIRCRFGYWQASPWQTYELSVAAKYYSTSEIRCVTPDSRPSYYWDVVNQKYAVNMTMLRTKSNVILEIALNGQQYSSESGVTFSFYGTRQSTALLKISPLLGPSTGGTLISITGVGFVDVGAVCRFTVPNSNPIFVSATVVNTNLLTCVSPNMVSLVTSAKAEVTVATALNGVDFAVDQSGSIKLLSFSVYAAPSVSKLFPPIGPITGGTHVYVIGSFATVAQSVSFAQCRFGDHTTMWTKVTAMNATVITCPLPKSNFAGNINFRISMNGEDTAMVYKDSTGVVHSSVPFFFYEASGPTYFNTISPTSGSSGGFQLTIITPTIYGANSVNNNIVGYKKARFTSKTTGKVYSAIADLGSDPLRNLVVTVPPLNAEQYLVEASLDNGVNWFGGQTLTVTPAGKCFTCNNFGVVVAPPITSSGLIVALSCILICLSCILNLVIF